MGIEITNTKIAINGKNIIFSNLSINQYLADVNSFSFTWRVPKDDNQNIYSEYVSFYKDNLAKQVVITIGTGNAANFTFKGFIYSISCSGRDDTATEYSVSGKGDIARIDEIDECNSYYKKSISDIFSDVLKNVDYTSQPQTTTELFYTVQYNQTKFDFLRLLAIRYGEWLFYDGQQLILGPVFGNAVPVQIQKDITDVNISAKIFKPSGKNTGFNTYEGKQIEKDGNEAAGINEEIITASANAGSAAFGNDQAFTNSYAILTDKDSFNNNIKEVAGNQMHSHYSNAMYMTAKSGNSKLALGVKLKVSDEKNNTMGEYIIVQANHFSPSASQYQNSIVAVPSDIKKPAYTNPHLYPVCKAQPAIVTDNEDDKKLGRIKVHFPWQQQNENTPWLPVMVPHAGKNKGFHFLPEKDEQVMIDFIGNNAERPYVIGAFYTEGNDHGNDHTGNNIKVIGTKTGRRLEIDDNKGQMALMDNFYSNYPMNSLFMNRDDNSVSILLGSTKDENTSSLISLDDKNIYLQVVSGVDTIASISLEADSKKITINSKGSIEISADQQIDIKSGTINIKASQQLNLEGTTDSVNIKGMKVTAEADTNIELSAKAEMKLEGAMLEATADTMGKFDGGATTTIKGGMVMIN